jgi:TonB family protein
MLFRILLASVVLLAAISPSRSQSVNRSTRVAVFDLGDSAFARKITEIVRSNLNALSDLKVSDPDLVRAAAKGIGYAGSLNMSVSEARDLGGAIASDFFLIGDAETLRRSSSKSPVYYESYCSIFIVSARTGQLIFWERPSFEAIASSAAEQQLLQDLTSVEARERWSKSIQIAEENERTERALIVDSSLQLIEAPDNEETAEAQGLQLPRPYRRLRPEYPASAARADAEATVDVVVDIGADGEVGEIQVARWAGFGLDETTVATVRQMHFFPAKRNGTPIPIRVLLRYNFRKPQN